MNKSRVTCLIRDKRKACSLVPYLPSAAQRLPGATYLSIQLHLTSPHFLSLYIISATLSTSSFLTTTASLNLRGLRRLINSHQDYALVGPANTFTGLATPLVDLHYPQYYTGLQRARHYPYFRIQASHKTN